VTQLATIPGRIVHGQFGEMSEVVVHRFKGATRPAQGTMWLLLKLMKRQYRRDCKRPMRGEPAQVVQDDGSVWITISCDVDRVQKLLLKCRHDGVFEFVLIDSEGGMNPPTVCDLNRESEFCRLWQLVQACIRQRMGCEKLHPIIGSN
jgi:hypothetical protein